MVNFQNIQDIRKNIIVRLDDLLEFTEKSIVPVILNNYTKLIEKGHIRDQKHLENPNLDRIITLVKEFVESYNAFTHAITSLNDSIRNDSEDNQFFDRKQIIDKTSEVTIKLIDKSTECLYRLYTDFGLDREELAFVNYWAINQSYVSLPRTLLTYQEGLINYQLEDKEKDLPASDEEQKKFLNSSCIPKEGTIEEENIFFEVGENSLVKFQEQLKAIKSCFDEYVKILLDKKEINQVNQNVTVNLDLPIDHVTLVNLLKKDFSELFDLTTSPYLNLCQAQGSFVKENLSQFEQTILSLPFFEYLNNLDEINPSSNPPKSNREILQNISNTIDSIERIESKIQLLRHVLDTGEWNHPDFDCLLENKEMLRNNYTWGYEMPFIGIHALCHNKINEEELCQLLLYFSLRHQYPAEKIEIIKPPVLCKDGEDKERWDVILRRATDCSPGYSIGGFSQEEYLQFKDNIENIAKDKPGRVVFFNFSNNPQDFYSLSFGLSRAGFEFFGEGQKERIAAPLIIYQEALKILFPQSYLKLVPKCGFTPVEQQYRRRSTQKNNGEIDIAFTCPCICEPFLKDNPEKNLQADGYQAPGCDLTLHDLYHAVIASSLPVKYRDYLLDIGKKITEDDQFWQRCLAGLEDWFKEQPCEDSIDADKRRQYIANKLFDMEHPARVFIQNAYHYSYKDRIRIPREPQENMELSLVSYGGNCYSQFLKIIRDFTKGK